MLQKIRESAKMLAALIGALLTAGTTLLPTGWTPWLSVVLAVATAVATFAIPNATPAVKK